MITLRDYQQEAIDALFAYFEEHDGNPLLVLPTGCHAKGTPIMLCDGTVLPVEKVLVGDILMGPTGQRFVLAVHRGRDQMFEIRPTSGSPFVVNAGHVLTLVRNTIDDHGSPLDEVIDMPLIEYLRLPVCFQRKLQLFRLPTIIGDADGVWRNPMQYAVRCDFTVHEAGEGRYFGFSVSGDHRYLLGDCTVTHNSGKSVVQAAFLERMERLYPGQRVLLLTHVKELIEQNYLKFRTLLPNVPCGIHSASFGRKDLGTRFLFGGIQSIWKKAEKIGPYDLIMIDEAHLVPARGMGMYRLFLDDMQIVNPLVKIIGLTATPFRLDSGLLTAGDCRIFTDIAYDLPLLRLINAGHLAPVISRGSLHHADLSGVHKRGGEFVEQEAAQAMMQITRSALDEVLELAADRRSWLLFATNIEHANQINAGLRQRGIASDVVTGETPKLARARLIDDFRRGRLRALANVMVLTTGFDAPATDCLVSMRPTLSAGLWLQMCGRGMRTAEGKENCLVLDYAGNIARHGPLDMIRGRPKEQSDETGEAPAKKCPQCGTLCHAALSACPNCGYSFPPPELKIEHQSSSGVLLSSQYADTTDYPVTGIEYEAHTSSRSGMTTLRVDYRCGLVRFSEYICVEHDGYARGKAVAWWVSMGGSVPPPSSVREAEDRAPAELRKPTLITVKRLGKYPEIVGYRFDVQEAA